MSKIMKALNKSKLNNERGSLNNVSAVDHPALNPVGLSSEHALSNGRFAKVFISVVIIMTLLVSGVVSIRSAVALDRTSQQVMNLSEQMTEQTRVIHELNKIINTASVVTPKDLMEVKIQLKGVEKNVMQNEQNLSDIEIASSLLEIAVDDLQISENIFVDKYISMSQDIDIIKGKIQREGREL